MSGREVDVGGGQYTNLKVSFLPVKTSSFNHANVWSPRSSPVVYYCEHKRGRPENEARYVPYKCCIKAKFHSWVTCTPYVALVYPGIMINTM